MRGIEAINVIVILVLAVITLLAVMLLFMGVINPAKSTSLQAATQVACQKVNPSFCKSCNEPVDVQSCLYAAMMPVFDFDANHNGTLNEHNPGGAYATTAGDDNLDSLCYNYYGCPNARTTTTSLAQWRDCCLIKVCGCPSYS